MQNSTIQLGDGFETTQWTRERLDSWKEVASFFRREVRTVQLWEKSEGLPVRRQYHKKLGSVYAYRQELEAWWVARSAMNAGFGKSEDAGVTPPPLKLEPRRAETVLRAAPALELPRMLAFPLAVIHSPLDRGPMRQIVERFAEGLREDLVLELMRLQFHLIVLPFKDLPSPGASTLGLMKNIAREFNAEILLSGSIRYSGNQLRIAVQVVRASDAQCLWSERFDARLDNVLQTQAELACRIGLALPEHLLRGNSPLRKREAAANNSLASQACSMGFHYWDQRGRSALMKALSYFQDAIELDPRCADAHAGLADTYISLSYNHLMPARQAATHATNAVNAALKLDANSMKVRNALINLLINCKWDWPAAERKCVEATQSGEMDGRTVQLYSSLMSCLGRHQDAVTLALHGYRNEPLNDLINGQVALAYFYAGDYNNTISFIRRTIELQPQFLMGYALLGRAEVELGHWSEAIAAFTQGIERSHHALFFQALLAYAYARGGEEGKAGEILRRLEDKGQDQCFPAYDVSAVHAILNQEKQALTNIYRAYDTRDIKTMFLKHDPRFQSLRHSSGFLEVESILTSGVELSCAV